MRRAVCPTFLTLTTVAKSLSMMTRGDDSVTEKIHFILRLLIGAVHLGIQAQQLPERPAQLVESCYGPS